MLLRMQMLRHLYSCIHVVVPVSWATTIAAAVLRIPRPGTLNGYQGCFCIVGIAVLALCSMIPDQSTTRMVADQMAVCFIKF
jgi:hypothetical protein